MKIGGSNMQTFEDKVAEPVRRSEVRVQKLRERTDFFERVASLLKSNHATTVSDLPHDVQQSIATELSRLTPEDELERQRVELEKLEAALLPHVAHLWPNA
jgi:hypothetical protein